MSKVEPKLTFEVGEKVVICSMTFGWINLWKHI